MAPSAEISIHFDNPRGSYFAGQSVSGAVCVVVHKAMRIRGIIMELKGETCVAWKEYKTKRHSVRSSTYSGSELHFCNKVYILGSDQGEVRLAPGRHTYSFAYQLPCILPSTFEGPHGLTRYLAAATIVDHIMAERTRAESTFKVTAPLDLNEIPAAKAPISLKGQKKFLVMSCKSGPLKLSVELPSGGFVSDQTIPIHIQVENESNVNVQAIESSLRRVVTWSIPGRRQLRTSGNLLLNHLQIPVNSKSSIQFCMNLAVPRVPPSSRNSTDGLINIKHLIRVSAIVTGFHWDLVVRVPIVIGTTPLALGPTEDIVDLDGWEFNSAMETGSWPGAQIPSAPRRTSPDVVESAPPPRYEECVRY